MGEGTVPRYATRTRKRKKTETNDPSVWICVKEDAVVLCRYCEDSLIVPASCIHADSLVSARWALKCDCGGDFTIDDFIDAGAVLKMGRDINLREI